MSDLFADNIIDTDRIAIVLGISKSATSVILVETSAYGVVWFSARKHHLAGGSEPSVVPHAHNFVV